MSDISRRNLLKGAAVSAVSISAMGLLGACAAPSEPKAETTTDPSADGTGTGSGTNSEYMAEVRGRSAGLRETDPALEARVRREMRRRLVRNGWESAA